MRMLRATSFISRVLLALCLAAAAGCAVSDALIPIAEQSGAVPGRLSVSASASGIALVNQSDRDVCFLTIEEGALAYSLLVLSAPCTSSSLRAGETILVPWAIVDGSDAAKLRYRVILWQVGIAPDGSHVTVYPQHVTISR